MEGSFRLAHSLLEEAERSWPGAGVAMQGQGPSGAEWFWNIQLKGDQAEGSWQCIVEGELGDHVGRGKGRAQLLSGLPGGQRKHGAP